MLGIEMVTTARMMTFRGRRKLPGNLFPFSSRLPGLFQGLPQRTAGRSGRRSARPAGWRSQRARRTRRSRSGPRAHDACRNEPVPVVIPQSAPRSRSPPYRSGRRSAGSCADQFRRGAGRQEGPAALHPRRPPVRGRPEAGRGRSRPRHRAGEERRCPSASRCRGTLQPRADPARPVRDPDRDREPRSRRRCAADQAQVENARLSLQYARIIGADRGPRPAR